MFCPLCKKHTVPIPGFVYGAKDNKKLKVFIDDLNLPACDENGIQRCNELLRQLLDERQLCTVQKPFEWRTVEGMSVISAMALSDYPGVVNKPLNERLLVSLVDQQTNEDLRGTFKGVPEITVKKSCFSKEK